MNVLSALSAHYGHLWERGDTPPYGYARERIAFALLLSHAGEPVGVSPLTNGSEQSPVLPLCEVPHPVRRTSRPSAKLLWDKTASVFGVKRDPATRKPRPAARGHQAFAALHERLLAHSGDEGLQALLRFVRTHGTHSTMSPFPMRRRCSTERSSSGSRATTAGCTSVPHRGRCGRSNSPPARALRACASSSVSVHRSHACIQRCAVSRGSYSRQLGETAARELGIDVNAVVEVGGWGVIRRYVERGIGICVVPSICLHETDEVS